MKQMGNNPTLNSLTVNFAGKGDDIDKWPASLRVREFPSGEMAKA